jgi:hypothetical protein
MPSHAAHRQIDAFNWPESPRHSGSTLSLYDLRSQAIGILVPGVFILML